MLPLDACMLRERVRWCGEYAVPCAALRRAALLCPALRCAALRCAMCVRLVAELLLGAVASCTAACPSTCCSWVMPFAYAVSATLIA